VDRKTVTTSCYNTAANLQIELVAVISVALKGSSPYHYSHSVSKPERRLSRLVLVKQGCPILYLGSHIAKEENKQSQSNIMSKNSCLRNMACITSLYHFFDVQMTMHHDKFLLQNQLDALMSLVYFIN